MTPRLYVVTGIPASGKSTVGRLLAGRFARSVLIEGDVIRRMVARGRQEMTPEPTREAVDQYLLRLRHISMLADSYVDSRFHTVVEDNIIGGYLAEFLELVRTRPVDVTVLAPDAEVVVKRDVEREKAAYEDETWTPEALDRVLRADTPRCGRWLDTSEQTAWETVDEILSTAEAGEVR